MTRSHSGPLCLGAALAMFLAGPAATLAAAPLPVEGPVLVVGPLGADRDAMIRQAGGRPLGAIDALLGELAMVVTGDVATFAGALRAAGAWAVLDGRAILALCGAGT